jgi:DNA-binding NarL/FixJ family response regulator
LPSLTKDSLALDPSREQNRANTCYLSRYGVKLWGAANHPSKTPAELDLARTGKPMCVKVLLADDAEVMRKAIRRLLSECEDISLVGEAATFAETVQKAKELLPDEIVLDLRMTEGEDLRLLAGTKLLAISLANDDEAKASAENIGASKFLDKMNLSRELIPAILELAPKSVASNLTSKRTYKFLQHNH